MTFSLQSLRYFVAVAEEGSVTGAARRLFISQPSVSATITQLEDALRQQLFVRRRAKGVILTPAGERLLPQARSLLAQADDFQTAATALDAGLSGTVRAACFVNLAPVYFAQLLAGFRASHPGITVRFQDGHQEEILDGVRSGVHEVALSFDLGDLKDFEVTELGSLPPMAVLSDQHPAANRDTVALHELAPEPLILMDLPLTRAYFHSLFRKLDLRPNQQYLARSFEMVRALAGNGLGYGILNLVPRTPTTYDGGRICAVPFKEPLPPLRVVAIRLREMPLRPVSRAFVEYAQSYFDGLARARLDPG